MKIEDKTVWIMMVLGTPPR